MTPRRRCSFVSIPSQCLYTVILVLLSGFAFPGFAFPGFAFPGFAFPGFAFPGFAFLRD